MMRIHLGISTCPNDTFAFHGILKKCVNLRGLEFAIELLDVEELNRRLLAGEFDVAKASFHAALYMTEQLGVLPVGSALGFGVGPILLGASPNTRPGDRLRASAGGDLPHVLCPGEHTTATLLYRLFHADEGREKQVVFSNIMPALQAKKADFGVCIHEGRFTWKNYGLSFVEDLGSTWEADTSSPLPLGGILARHRLGEECMATLTAVIRDSLSYAEAHREEVVSTMRQYAQELSEGVMFQHVDLYVNEWTYDLGDVGRSALFTLHERATDIGLLPPTVPRLTVY